MVPFDPHTYTPCVRHCQEVKGANGTYVVENFVVAPTRCGKVTKYDCFPAAESGEYTGPWFPVAVLGVSRLAQKVQEPVSGIVLPWMEG